MRKEQEYMKRALFLACKGRGKVAPNPLVGAVIVKNSQIIAEGWHHHYGSTHAEVEALRQAGDKARGADLFVNLEPCSRHWEGKHHPPCTDAIISAGVRRVYIAHMDPHPYVHGSGISTLRAQGVVVSLGLLADKAHALNEAYTHYVRHKSVFVHLKYAQSLDAYIATRSGEARWISSRRARKHVHELRAAYCGILVGSGTVHMDNPSLTVRHVRGVNPQRFVVDSSLRVDDSSMFVRLAEDGKSTLFTAEEMENSDAAVRLRNKGVRVHTLPRDETGYLSLSALLDALYHEHHIYSLLVEGGATLLRNFLHQNRWHKMTIYIAPVLLGAGRQIEHVITSNHMARIARKTIQWRRFHDTMAAEMYNE